MGKTMVVVSSLAVVYLVVLFVLFSLKKKEKQGETKYANMVTVWSLIGIVAFIIAFIALGGGPFLADIISAFSR